MKDESLPLIPPSDHGQSHDEIVAEIADHLAAAEADLTKRGIAAGEAREAARKKFGDVEKIQRTCYWIQNGETIMLRWTLVALASILCILLGLSVLGNWRTQSQLAEEIGKLSAELKALAAAKQAPPPTPQPPEITGVIYAGSKDKPVAGADVCILRSDGTIIRRLSSDDKGAYQSGPLEPGDFCITTPVQQAPAHGSEWIAQSQPVVLHATSGGTQLDLDAAYHAGGLKFGISRDLPRGVKAGNYRIETRLHVFVLGSRQRDFPWTAKENFPNRWPVYCNPTFRMQANRSAGISQMSKTFSPKLGQELEFCGHYSTTAAILPSDELQIEAALWIEAFPLDGSSTAIQFMSNRLSQELPLQKVAVKDGHFTKILVEIPPGIDEDIQNALESISDAASVESLVRGGRLCRHLKFKVVGSEPMKDVK